MHKIWRFFAKRMYRFGMLLMDWGDWICVESVFACEDDDDDEMAHQIRQIMGH